MVDGGRIMDRRNLGCWLRSLAHGNALAPLRGQRFLIGLLVLTLPGLPKFRRWGDNNEGDLAADAQPVIAMYFFVTLLLLFCAISVRFCMVNLA